MPCLRYGRYTGVCRAGECVGSEGGRVTACLVAVMSGVQGSGERVTEVVVVVVVKLVDVSTYQCVPGPH